MSVNHGKSQETYLQAYHDLLRAASETGLPEEVGKLLAKNLQSERSIRRMTSYLRNAHPRSMEMIADEMLAIMEDQNHWIQKKQAEESNSRYNAWLNSDMRQTD